MVPNGWEQKRLIDVSSVKRGAGSQYLEYVEKPDSSSVRLIRISDFMGDKPKFVTHTKDINRFILEKDDILIAGTGATAGIVFEVPESYVGMAYSYNAPRIKVNNFACKSFVSYYLKSCHILRQQQALFTGNAQPFLDTKAIGGFKLNLPPLPEQRKIAKILSTWDKAISTTEKLIETSKQQKKALMQQLLTGKKRLVNQETGKAFDRDWNSQPISSLITESRIAGTNGELARKLTVKLYGRGVTQKEEKRLGSSSTKYYKRKSGQFIYSKLDFLNGAFGIIPEHLDGFESTLDLPAFDFSEAVEPKWFIEFVSRDDFYTSNLGLANGGRKARRVNPKDLLQIKVQVPSLEEQQKIASVLTAADKDIEVLQAKHDHLKREKKALMQQLLTGKRRVKVDEEVAA